MKNLILYFLFFLILYTSFSYSQDADKSELTKGKNFIETKTYTPEEDAEILELFKGLRVADVSDGMDMIGLPGTGLVDPVIQPVWKDLKDLSHHISGIAVTVRYVPTQKPDRPKPGEDFDEWQGNFYDKYSSEVFSKLIRPGNIIAIDDAEEKDIGSIGSYNILEWHKRGAVGVVTDACSRDNDEIAIEKVPLYARKKGRGIRPGRNELESVNRPIVIGGVLVCPGDVIVADGDGVIVVPRSVAKQVAKYARKILDEDKAGRKELYDSLKIPLDKTVK
jgi:4-hydroxy-4-methyl-2-oxoglutarate aldolase